MAEMVIIQKWAFYDDSWVRLVVQPQKSLTANRSTCFFRPAKYHKTRRLSFLGIGTAAKLHSSLVHWSFVIINPLVLMTVHARCQEPHGTGNCFQSGTLQHQSRQLKQGGVLQLVLGWSKPAPLKFKAALQTILKPIRATKPQKLTPNRSMNWQVRATVVLVRHHEVERRLAFLLHWEKQIKPFFECTHLIFASEPHRPSA